MATSHKGYCMFYFFVGVSMPLNVICWETQVGRVLLWLGLASWLLIGI